MKLTRTSAQAALAMAFLARQSDAGLLRARDVAAHLQVPTDSALKILQTLVRQRLLQSQLGRNGGYRLGVDPSTISLLRLVEAIDGPVRADLPLEAAGDDLAPPLRRLRQACEASAQRLREELASISVADLVSVETTAGRLTPPLAAAG